MTILIILDLLEPQSTWDTLRDCIAVPLNWYFLKTKNRDVKPNPASAEAMTEHQRTDEYLTFSQAQDIYSSFFINPKPRRHLFWRYSLVWQKSTAT